MGIQVEFNPDLALRAIGTPDREEIECIPDDLEPGKFYSFLKRGQRNYWFEGEIPLLETNGEGRLSRPVASIIIVEATHFRRDGEMWTRGIYKVIKTYDPADKTIHFEGMNKLRGEIE